jgi:hypothetical protein
MKNLKKTNQILSYLPLIFVLASLLALWSYLGSGYEPRRLFLFSPFIALLILQGVLLATRLLKVPEKYGLISFSIFVVSALSYFWIRYEDISLINLRSFGLVRFEFIDYYVLGTLFVLIMALPKVLAFALNRAHRYLEKNKLLRGFLKMTTLFVIVAFISQAMLVNGISNYYLSLGAFNGDFNSYQSMENFYISKGWNTKYLLGDFPQIISYFKGLPDSYGVLGFYIQYLKLFGNRSIVDLTWTNGYEKFGKSFSLNQTMALKELYNNNIRYVLIPNSNYPISSVYQTYLNAKLVFPFLNDSVTPITELIDRNQYVLAPLCHFTCYDLYSIKQVAYPYYLHPLIFGNADYVAISPSASLNLSRQVTVETWVYMNGLPSQVGKNFEIVGKQWNTLRVLVSKDTNTLCVVQSYNGVTFNYQAKSVLLTKTWYHFAFTFDGNVLNIYVDSILSLNVTVAGILGTNTFPLIIHGYANETSNSVGGIMAAFRIYNRALDPEEIAWNMGNSLCPVENSLVLWYKFNETSGSIIHDSSGNGNDGIINGATRLD